MPRRLLTAGAMLWSLSLAAAGDKPASRPAPQADAWLGQIILEELPAVARTGQYADLAEWATAASFGYLSSKDSPDLRALAEAVYVLRACRALPAADEIDDKLAEWLVGHRDLSRRLFRAVGEGPPNEPLARLMDLRKSGEQAVLDYPDLAVAFVTSQPIRTAPGQPASCSMAESFAWYAGRGPAGRFDLKTLPYELSRYLADTRLSLTERRWAIQSYGRAVAPIKAFTQVPFDLDHLLSGKDKKIAALPYTLENLRKAGGTCADQAYYAAEVCKAMGIPAAVVSGTGVGAGHAWTVCLALTAGKTDKAHGPSWDFAGGRYKEQLSFVGTAVDPSTGAAASDSELPATAATARLTLDEREESDAAATMARLVDSRRENPPEDTLLALKNLAELYRQRHGDAPAPDAASLRATREPGPSMVHDLLEQAIRRNPCERAAWRFILELAEAKRLPPEATERFLALAMSVTAGASPEFAEAVATKLAASLSEVERQEKVLRQAIGAFTSRPDIQGRLAVALGDHYRGRALNKEALTAYEQAAVKYSAVGPVLLEATAKLEALLVEDGKRPDLAIQMYSRLLPRAAAGSREEPFRRWSARYVLAHRLADLLNRSGKSSEARQVLRSIGE